MQYNLDMDEYILQTYEALTTRIREIPDYRVRRDLLKMYKTCENLRREIAQEQVNSRNVATSHKLLHLHNKFAESVTNLDQYVTLALLSI